MLDGCSDSFALDSADVASRDPAGQKRIFGVIFEVSAAQRIALDVDARGEQDIDSIFENLIAYGSADLLDKRWIPGGSKHWLSLVVTTLTQTLVYWLNTMQLRTMVYR